MELWKLLSTTKEGLSILETIENQRVTRLTIRDLLYFLIPRVFSNLFPSRQEKENLAKTIVRTYPQTSENMEDLDWYALYDIDSNTGLMEEILSDLRKLKSFEDMSMPN